MPVSFFFSASAQAGGTIWKLETGKMPGPCATSNWVTPAETVQDNLTNKFIIVNPPTGNRFYRLRNP